MSLIWGNAYFFKEQKLRQYVTGDISRPTQATAEIDEKYAEQLKDCDRKNHQIITWHLNTSIPRLHLHFGQFDTVKEAWTHEDQWYTTIDLSHLYRPTKERSNLKQERGQPVKKFLLKWILFGIINYVWACLEKY